MDVYSGQKNARLPSPAWHGSLAVDLPKAFPGLHPVSLGQSGSLEVRLARTPAEIKAAQKLRYKVFFKERGLVPNLKTRLSRRDVDAYDALCDHLLVIDHAAGSRSLLGKKLKIVGTYRLLRGNRLKAVNADFYSAGEYELGAMTSRFQPEELLELGRSCVLKPYRTKRTVELLWQGIWRYVQHYRIKLLFGCASFDGADPNAHATALEFLASISNPSGLPKPRALPALRARYTAPEIKAADGKSIIRSLPPLVKAYLKVGATFGDGAVVDRAFGTTDVFVFIAVDAIDPRYIAHYDAA